MDKIKVLLRKDKSNGEILIVFPNKTEDLEYYTTSLKCHSSMSREYYYEMTMPCYTKEAMEALKEYAGNGLKDFDVIKKMNYR